MAKNNDNDCSFYMVIVFRQVQLVLAATPEVAVQQIMLYYQRGIVNTSFVAGVCWFADF